MKKAISRGLAVFVAVSILCAQAFAMPERLVPVGRTVGIHLAMQPVVTGFSEGGCARDAGVRVGDCIVSADGQEIFSAEELRQRIGSEPLRLGVTRDGDYLEFTMTPETIQDNARLGLRLRDGITGVGTVTFYDPQTGRYGALGHGVNDPATSRPLQAVGGSIMAACVTEAVRGAPGRPGELRARFSMQEPIGTIDGNCAAGICGAMHSAGDDQPIPLAEASRVKAGPARILCNVEGEETRAYGAEILKIDPKNEEGHNFLLRICDERLLEITGGIVQGMSGSPIVQEGCLVGAVTHVLVDEPTLGYGISIETMLDRTEPASFDAGLHPKKHFEIYGKICCQKGIIIIE